MPVGHDKSDVAEGDLRGLKFVRSCVLRVADRAFLFSFPFSAGGGSKAGHMLRQICCHVTHMAAGTDPRGSESVVPIGALGSSSPSIDRGASGAQGDR